MADAAARPVAGGEDGANHRARPTERVLLVASGALGAISPILARAGSDPEDAAPLVSGLMLAIAALAGLALAPRSRALAALLPGVVSSLVAWRLLDALGPAGDASAVVGPAFWLQVVGAWLMAWATVERLAAIEPGRAGSGGGRGGGRWARTLTNLLIPLLFGAWLLLLWEFVTRGLGVPQVLLPAPSVIAERFAGSTSILWADFRQTFLKAVLIGYALGCGAGFLVAILIDRSAFLKRGLLPIGNLVSALPIVGVAPIMVMWFGFDWPSKAAVVVVMTFFPMLVNTVSGLAAAGPMQRDLMRTYAASYVQDLVKLRLPEAMPFVFNALKINSTLALIGAIVAEFFGTPTVGMGFRISTEVGRMNVDMVWAEIAVAALAGSAFYALIALLERATTFWHPSVRRADT